MSSVPAGRIRELNSAECRPAGDFVLYWMVAARRTHFNFGLQHALDRARELNKPLVVLEALRCDYPWAADRFHRFIIDGMADNAARFERAGVTYLPYVEPRIDAGRGLLEELARHACLVVTDDYPAFMLPRMVAAGAARCKVLVEAVDSNGLLPLSAADRAFPTAYAFRRFLQRTLREHLDRFPKPNPLLRLSLPALRSLPTPIRKRWPSALRRLGTDPSRVLGQLPIDHSVGAVASRGGSRAAQTKARAFMTKRLEAYDDRRNDPEAETTSGLSPYLHFGQISSHQVCLQVLDREGWTADRLAESCSGSRAGWWGLSPAAEAFLDQLVTWRELGYNMCRQREDYARYESLPDWALETLELHATDPREHLYDLESFESATTHDPLWNAAQRQLRQEGRIQNYLRMLWGKKILEWSASPRAALEIMVALNDKYALDGRDPNSYSGIFWVLGRYDRAWGPERPVFGKVRYMSSASTARKLRVKGYLERFGCD